MAKRNAKQSTRTAGRTTLTPCRYLDEDRVCEPLNAVWLLDADAKVTKRYGACTCGRRFGPADVPKDLPAEAVDFLAELASLPAGEAPLAAPLVSNAQRDDAALTGATERTVAPADAALSEAPESPAAPIGATPVDGPASVTRLDEVALAEVVAGLWPAERTHEWARDGVVPVGQVVMHEPTTAIDRSSPSAAALGERLLATQEAAEGIGLAANQVGAPVRVLAHNFPRVAPQIFVNPTLLSSEGVWEYEEGCLSLHVEDTPADVLRPKVIVVHTELLDGTQLVTRADELFARVLLHELDHLDGIEYVQRLTGRTARRVYKTMEKAGIDTERWLPPRPY